MKVEKFNDLEIELYDSAMELPEERFSMFNRYVLIDSGVGADIESFDNHLLLLSKYSQKGDKDNEKKVIQNIRQCVYLILNDINPETMAFCCFVKSINGVEYGDSEDEMNKIRARLRKGKMPKGLIRVLKNMLKKKSTRN